MNKIIQSEYIEQPKGIKPVTKSHLFLTKLRRISSVDRQLRRKWSLMQKSRIKAQQQKQKQYLDIVRLQQRKQSQQYNQWNINSLTKTKNSRILSFGHDKDQQMLKNDLNAVSISHYQSSHEANSQDLFKITKQIKRSEVLKRKKKYDDIYFQKKKLSDQKSRTKTQNSVSKDLIASSSLLGFSPHKSNKYRLKTQNDLPYYLRKPDLKQQRQNKVLQTKYIQEMKLITKKKGTEQLKNSQSQTTMLKKLKGKKFYYKFTSSWSLKDQAK